MSLRYNLLPLVALPFRIILLTVPPSDRSYRQALWIAALLLSSIGLAGQVPLQPNLALGKPVVASGPTWNGLDATGVTDGNPATFSHPLAEQDTLDFYFEIDLGASYFLERILIRNRSDGCCPERLTNYRVEIFSDEQGEAGALTWSTTVRSDGSNSGISGIDTVTAGTNAQGIFAGRFIRIVNNGGAAYSPQVAEVEAYGGAIPEIKSFAAEPDVLSAGESAQLRWEIQGAQWAAISPGIGIVAATNGTAIVQPLQTTTYTLTASNQAGVFTATATVGVDLALEPPRISEFMADNSGGLKDADGDSADWIEISNPNAFTLNLEGYYLSDDPARAFQWAFPSLRLPPKGILVVFASGKDRRVSGAELHTNFRLDATGEYLALNDKLGLAVQRFPTNYPAATKFPAQTKNASYGFGSDGTLGYFRPSTPGMTNGIAFEGAVADTKFSFDRGFYDTNFNLMIACATPGAEIRYTLDRSEPSQTHGSIYSAPIPITQTVIVRAAAFRTGWAPTEIDTQTYVFLSNVITGPLMRTNITRNTNYAAQMRPALLDLPSISLTTTLAINDTTEVKTSIEWLSPDGRPGFQEDCGIKHFGGAFTTFSKKNFRLYFRSAYGTPKLKYPLFEGFDRDLAPVDEFNQLELRGGSHDMAQRGFYMSNPFTDDTLLAMGQLNPHGRFVHLYLNGAYWGIFHLRERWDAAMHQSYLGGSRSNYESINGNWNVGGWAEPGSPYDGDGSAWARIKSLRGDYSEVKPFLDVPQYVDFMLMWMFGGAEDEYRCVGPTGPGSGFKFYLNDADGWFCIPAYCAAGNRTTRGTPGRSSGDGPGSLFSMLFQEGDADYRVLLADRIHNALFNFGPLTPSENLARLNTRCQEIERAFLAESARWNFLTPTEWNSRRASASNWLSGRSATVLGQFRDAGFYPSIDAPAFNQQGGKVPAGFQVALTAPRGVIHFTVDGTDPRLPGGAISPAARSLASPVTTQTLVPTRALWRWFTDATGLGSSDLVAGSPGWSTANWKHKEFDDRLWNEGPAQLGYGENDESTVIPFGANANNKWITAYFRHQWRIDATNGFSNVTLRLKRDDGAIVYLNEREVVRSSMPAGEVSGSTLAIAAPDDGQNFEEFQLPADFLIAGTNVIAVEVHQTIATSSDLSFDLELSVQRPSPQAGSNSLPALTDNTLIKARARDGSEWSALNEAFFQVASDAIASGDVAVTELNFDSRREGSEFVELSNLSSHAVNLRGLQFVEGIKFSFPANRDTPLASGQRLVLVKDLYRFQQKYGIDLPVGGIYSSSLAKDGERMTLSAGSNIISSFAYRTSAPWPTFGQTNFSLVLSRPQLGLDHPGAWRLSAEPDGSPGSPDSTTFSGDPAADRDNDGLLALIEYVFGTSDDDPSDAANTVEAMLDAFGNLTISFPRNRAADDVLLEAEQSHDILNWSPAVLLSSEASASGISRETWGANAGGRRTLFLRLRASRL